MSYRRSVSSALTQLKVRKVDINLKLSFYVCLCLLWRRKKKFDQLQFINFRSPSNSFRTSKYARWSVLKFPSGALAAPVRHFGLLRLQRLRPGHARPHLRHVRTVKGRFIRSMQHGFYHNRVNNLIDREIRIWRCWNIENKFFVKKLCTVHIWSRYSQLYIEHTLMADLINDKNFKTQ